MQKSTKTVLIVVMAAVAALALLWFARYWFSGCGGIDADLVFVSDTDTPIGSVSVDTKTHTEVGQYADNSPMKRGESFGFEVEDYPVTVTVYQRAGGKGRLASCVIEKAPEGDRWYVVARDGENGIEMAVSGQWPSEGAGALGAEPQEAQAEQLIWDEGARPMESWEIWGIALFWTVLLALPLILLGGVSHVL